MIQRRVAGRGRKQPLLQLDVIDDDYDAPDDDLMALCHQIETQGYITPDELYRSEPRDEMAGLPMDPMGRATQRFWDKYRKDYGDE